MGVSYSSGGRYSPSTMPMLAPPAVMICQRPGLKARAWKSRLLVPPPDRGDIVTHGGLVQLEAALAVGGGGRPQCDGSHSAARSGRSGRAPVLQTAPAPATATKRGSVTGRPRSQADWLSMYGISR